MSWRKREVQFSFLDVQQPFHHGVVTDRLKRMRQKAINVSAMFFHLLKHSGTVHKSMEGKS